jgi:hypothetical protein
MARHKVVRPKRPKAPTHKAAVRKAATAHTHAAKHVAAVHKSIAKAAKPKIQHGTIVHGEHRQHGKLI